MPWLLNALYLLALLAVSPWLIYRALRTGRYRQGLREKLFGLRQALPPGAVWFHGVSVGEIHLLRQVVAAFRRRRPDLPCVISTTTDTGFTEARKAFPDLAVFRFPFDFSWAVRRTLRQVRPSLAVLAEAEVWPNFLLACNRLGVPVAIINARMSPRSLRRYETLGVLSRRLFARLDLVAVQSEDYAAALARLGVRPDRLSVTGSVKYDGVLADRDNPRIRELRRLLSVGTDEQVWIAGSTQAPEEEIALGVYRRLLPDWPRLRLILVPRQPDRFDEVARLLERSGLPFVRRSSLGTSALPAPRSTLPIVLVDTIGELRALWGLADVAFVGGSLDGRRGGQNMIEPAACAAAVLFGPHVWNFREAAARLIEAGGACQVHDDRELEATVRRLLGDASERRQMGQRARDFVLRQQGATERTVKLLEDLLARHPSRAGERAA
jgi:3-deoxy-D-manno-octulosonic-acid transferase